jgi:hypothetical protein
MMQLLRYALRIVLALFLVLDFMLLSVSVFPQHEVPAATRQDRLYMLLLVSALVSIQAGIIWFDLHLGKRVRRTSEGAA